jgi:hypothetical protein
LSKLVSICGTLFAVGAALTSLGHAQTPANPPLSFVFRSSSIDFPTGDRTFPGGAQAEAINNNCLACHSAGMVLNQPGLSKSAWEAEVHKMIDAYKAPVAAVDVSAIVDYLVSTKGQKKNASGTFQ